MSTLFSEKIFGGKYLGFFFGLLRTFTSSPFQRKPSISNKLLICMMAETENFLLLKSAGIFSSYEQLGTNIPI